MVADAFFLPASPGQRLCIHHAPQGPARGVLLYLHPWAEEMNKARRMAALQSRALAAAGYAVLQIDLHGCGDSSGDFADASWAGWVDDALAGAHWLQTRHPEAPLWLWGLRAGSLLATDAAQRLAAPCHFLFWQPAPLGKLLLQQFMRLRAAADMQQADAKATMDRLRQDLAEGRPVEIAGYRLPPALAAGLEQASLRPPAAGSPASRLVWLELSTREDATLLPASTPRIEAWRSAGHSVDARVVPGPAFWQTQEIEDAPALITTTLDALDAAAP